MSTTAIIGGGITGLTTAYALKKKGIAVDVIESNSQVGGAIKTLKDKNKLLELGPHTLQLNNQKVLDLLKDLDLENEIIKVSPLSKNRCILKNGKLIPLPLSPLKFITTPLFSLKAKLRLLKEPFIKAGTNTESESIASFVNRRLGPEFLDYSMDPFVAGVFAGNPNGLCTQYAFPRLYSMEKEHGSLIKAMIKGKKPKDKIKTEIISFKNGMQTLPLRLAEKLGESLHLNAKALSIQRDNKAWKLSWEANGKEFTRVYSNLIITCPVHRFKSLPLEDPLKSALQPLQNLPYVPVSMIHLGFDKTAIKHPLNGFGFLVPSKEDARILGALFPSSFFPSQYPQDTAVFTVFIGGARHPELTELSPKETQAIAVKELKDLLSISSDPKWAHYKNWPQGIPQYNLNYSEFIDKLNNVETTFPGLHLAGNYREGIGVPHCILNALKLAERITLTS